MEKLFSIIIVCLNPGQKLELTLKSVEKQTFRDYEVIIKDGLSTDGSLHYAQNLAAQWESLTGEKVSAPSLKILSQKDAGIYDAMNQAAGEAAGNYVYFLNAGDYLYEEGTLQEMADFIRQQDQKEQQRAIFYGNIYERKTGQQVTSNPHMDAFGCYRNVPCHQACFYSRELLLAHSFEPKYKVRADYEQFLWCFFEGKAALFYKSMLIADYEGGGYSETRENRKVSAREHREITGIYLSSFQRFKYRAMMWVTLAPLRTALAENPQTAGLYNRLRGALYTRK